jgi:hypothetical protein
MSFPLNFPLLSRSGFVRSVFYTLSAEKELYPRLKADQESVQLVVTSSKTGNSTVRLGTLAGGLNNVR